MFLDNYLNDREFLKRFDEYPHREQTVKIEVLDFSERPISEIQGKCQSGSVNIDGASSMRRTCSFNMLLDNETFDVLNTNNLISINKKIRVSIGFKNFLGVYDEDILWFPMGVFVVINVSMNHNTQGGNLSVTAKDKMCLLNGEVSGILPAPVTLHEKSETAIDGSTIITDALIYEIIRESVIHLGGEDPSRVFVNDVALEVKKVYRYIGNTPIHFDKFGNQIQSSSDPNYGWTVTPDSLAGYALVPFGFPGELVKQAGEPVTAILDAIVNTLGNYEYFYDVDGNFIFQEIKNYLNTAYTPITKLDSGDYTINFGESTLAYSFKNTHIISSYANNPNYMNIKNDFVVWGKRVSPSGAQLPIRLHVAIDNLPRTRLQSPDYEIFPGERAGGTIYSMDDNIIPDDFKIYTDSLFLPTVEEPWQVQLYRRGLEAEKNGIDPGYYWRELKNELPKLYDLEAQRWKNFDGLNIDYYLDFINSDSEFGKFSVDTIGRRTVVVNDDKVTHLYRPDTPDFIIFEKGKVSTEILDKLNARGQSFMIVDDIKQYSFGGIGKDAFSVVRELIFKHTNYSETISLNSMPIYYLEPNTRIEVEDELSSIYGEYIIKSMSIPLSHDGQMTTSAVRATNRI